MRAPFKGKNMAKAKRVLEPHETNEYVIGIYWRLGKILDKELSKIHEKQRFLIAARIVNIFYNRCYGLTVQFTEEDKPKAE